MLYDNPNTCIFYFGVIIVILYIATFSQMLFFLLVDGSASVLSATQSSLDNTGASVGVGVTSGQTANQYTGGSMIIRYFFLYQCYYRISENVFTTNLSNIHFIFGIMQNIQKIIMLNMIFLNKCFSDFAVV